MPEKSVKFDGPIADAASGNWVDRFAPAFAKPYLKLARIDRPIGIWLLFWPCAWSLALAGVARPDVAYSWFYTVIFLIGAIAMRGAGCTLNDIVDRKLDAQVERTRSRPIPSGQVSVKQAVVFLLAQCLIGLVVLLQLNNFAIWLGFAALIPVAIYPFMKRITNWPQLFLGIAFKWGALIGWAAMFGALHLPALILYAGAICWTIGYDTIYALQDREDDAVVGIKSTALLFGEKTKIAVTGFYALSFALLLASGYYAGAGIVFFVATLPTAALLIWQVATLKIDDGANCLVRFQANKWIGLAFWASLLLEYWL